MVEGGEAPSGVLLTFDDGLRDHIDCVLPVLRTRNLWGLFYVPSKPIAEGRLLDVHKVHLALGRLGGAAVLTWLEQNAPKSCRRLKNEMVAPHTTPHRAPMPQRSS